MSLSDKRRQKLSIFLTNETRSSSSGDNRINREGEINRRGHRVQVVKNLSDRLTLDTHVSS